MEQVIKKLGREAIKTLAEIPRGSHSLSQGENGKMKPKQE